MRAYYFDNEPSDQRLPHDYNPSRPVDPSVLQRLGLLHWNVPVKGHENEINRISTERAYKNSDIINMTREGLGESFDVKIKNFYVEHLHEDEEIRYILDGSGYFDVRENSTEEWIRIAVSAGDLIVLPAGIYHRFTLDTNDKILTMRLFKDEPKWTALNRSSETETNPHRVEYLQSIGAAA